MLRKCQALAKYLHLPPHCTTSSLTMDITLKASPTISLSGIGRAVKQVQRDGNCFFRAISLQIAGSEKYHLEIRNMVIRYEEMNRVIFETYLRPSTNKPTIEGLVELLYKPNS